jgi:DNA invertase Pin-like site-specific DNA recombinase
MGQVRHHQESTERQYALKDKALHLEWSPQMIRVLDRDLGVSGAHATGREDFKTLFSDVAMGTVGAIFALEASRLARSNLDWHRLIEICALTKTLVIDEDGCYDPADFNDALLLGLKATIAQAELHFIRARLQGGKLNKAKKGELRSPLPVGLCYDDEGQVVLDPDQEVQGAVRLIFELFEQTGSAYAVAHHFAKEALKFPKRAYGGAWDGKLIWGRLTHSRVLGVLKNPSYAGVYTFGRYQSQKEISVSGEVRTTTKPVPMDCWRVVIQDHHDAYISWQQFEKNQVLLQKNRTNDEGTHLSGPAREGLALLQGLLLCWRCGRKVSVRYKGNGGIYPTYDCNWQRREGIATKSCLNIRCDLLDKAISDRVLAVLEPNQIDIAYEAVRQLEKRDSAIMAQWKMRLERAEYEAQLAERRYEEVDPSNRLVASTLEKRWNDALSKLEDLKAQFAEVQSKEACVVTEEQRQKILALAKDFPRLWNAPSTRSKDKKRMLRLLIKDITVERDAERRVVTLHVRWQGGACEDILVTLPPKVADRVRYPEEVVQRVRQLAQSLPDKEIAETLNGEGLSPSKGDSFNVSIIRWIRYKHQIPSPQLRQPGELTVKEIAGKFGVSRNVVYYWLNRGIIDGRRRNKRSSYWITLDDQKEAELRKIVRTSVRIQKQRRDS